METLALAHESEHIMHLCNEPARSVRWLLARFVRLVGWQDHFALDSWIGSVLNVNIHTLSTSSVSQSHFTCRFTFDEEEEESARKRPR